MTGALTITGAKEAICRLFEDEDIAISVDESMEEGLFSRISRPNFKGNFISLPHLGVTLCIDTNIPMVKNGILFPFQRVLSSNPVEQWSVSLPVLSGESYSEYLSLSEKVKEFGKLHEVCAELVS